MYWPAHLWLHFGLLPQVFKANLSCFCTLWPFFLNSLPSYLSGDKSLHRAIFGPNFINFRRVPTVIFLFFFKSDNDFDKLISLTSALKTNCNMAILAILNFTYLSQSHTVEIEIQRNIDTLFWVYLQSFTIMLSTDIPLQCRTKLLNQQRERSYVSPSLAQSPVQLVGCRTQLICTWIFICSMEKLKEHNREICTARAGCSKFETQEFCRFWTL